MRAHDFCTTSLVLHRRPRPHNVTNVELGSNNGRVVRSNTHHGPIKHSGKESLLKARHLLLIVTAAISNAYGANASQPVPPIFESEFSVCYSPVSQAELAKLTAARNKYTSAISQIKARLIKQGVDPEDPPADIGTELRTLQAQLLAVDERLECHYLRQPLVHSQLLGPKEKHFVEFRIRFATDRPVDQSQATAANRNPHTFFTGNPVPEGDFGGFSFGTVAVTVPTLRQPGSQALPPWWLFTSQPDPNHYFLLRDLQLTDQAAMLRDLGTAEGAASANVLLFVHGFNVTFAEAALRSAQLAQDLRFPGKVMFYSWPSAGAVKLYWQDEESARISTARFKDLLKSILASGVAHVYIVAHSMGTRIVIDALPELRTEGVDTSKISELVLAAADYNEILFRQQMAVLYKQFKDSGTHTTIYASSNDFALKASKVVHTYRRLGESSPRLSAFDGLDSIDASLTAPERRAFGHSYVCDSAAVLGDMQEVVLKHESPNARGLESMDNSGFSWRIPRSQ
jgi:esterase/lipase superfamily enzyme